MNPVIFLDIDGVINPSKPNRPSVKPVSNLHLLKAEEKNWPGIASLGEKMVNQFCGRFDPAACQLISRLQQESGADVIVTSSWRVYYTFEQLQSIFKLFDIEIHGLLPHGFPRSSQISAYVRAHQIKHWVAVDDMDMEKPLGFHFIKTDSSFSQADYEKARRRIEL